MRRCVRQGCLTMGGQIVDASLVACPKQRNTDAEKQAIKEGRIPEAWTGTLPSWPKRTGMLVGR